MREQDVFERGERGDELVGLEDEADGLAADLGELVLGQVADGGAVEVDVAGGGCVQTGEQAEEGRFAAAGGTHDGDELAFGDGEVEAFEDVDGARAVADRLAESIHDNHGRGASGAVAHEAEVSLCAASTNAQRRQLL